MSRGAQRRFPRKPESGFAARRWIREQSHIWLPGWKCDDLLIVTSELVTNAIKHGGGLIDVALTLAPPSLRILVHDQGRGSVAMIDARPDDLHGRGLHIVAKLSEEWGTSADTTKRGNSVWATFRIS
jgi:anti-sigma regulatory factor (Ser/Thr protein kinase)